MITDQREGIEYLVKNKKGNMEDLKKNISPNLIDTFKLFGYLKVDTGKDYRVRL
jgi:hypothetical protein